MKLNGIERVELYSSPLNFFKGKLFELSISELDSLASEVQRVKCWKLEAREATERFRIQEKKRLSREFDSLGGEKAIKFLLPSFKAELKRMGVLK